MTTTYPYPEWTASVARCTTLAKAREANARWGSMGWTMDYFLESQAAGRAYRTCAQAIALLSFLMPGAE